MLKTASTESEHREHRELRPTQATGGHECAAAPSAGRIRIAEKEPLRVPKAAY